MAISLSGNNTGGKGVLQIAGRTLQRRLSLEASRVIEFSEPNGATCLPGSKTQSPRHRSLQQWCHRVMASAGDCAFDESSPVRSAGLALSMMALLPWDQVYWAR
jgi:hypothetical protein